MPKSPNQKLKLLYLLKILSERTDDAHALTLAQIIAALDAYGIRAERKTVYDDLQALRDFDVDVCTTRHRTTGYYIGARKFQLAELKLLVDSVQASKFITEKKTLELIKKLESLLSVHEARLMHRQVYVPGRVKSMNESIYYNIDAIHSAISENRQITFRYFEYNAAKQKCYRRNGARYCVSPYALVWDDENYYLLGYDPEAGIIKHYRADKMDKPEAAADPREGQALFAQVDMAAYTRRNFRMFGGEEQLVTLVFHNSLANVAIDRFGKDAPIAACDEEHFRVTLPVAVSPQFYGWVFGLGEGVRITAPEEAVEGMRRHVEKVAALYRQQA